MSDILVLAIGNDILGDDGISFAALDALKEKFPEGVDFEKVYTTGIDILDLLENRKKVLILDSITTGSNPVGTIYELLPETFRSIPFASPHYLGLPEIIELGKVLDLFKPIEIKILAIEIEFQLNVSEGLSPKIKSKLPDYLNQAEEIIKFWLKNA